MYELQQIMRQKEDKLFAQLLNRLRLVTIMSKNQCTFVTRLFATNALVNLPNNAIFQMSANQKPQIPAIDVVVGDVFEQIKQKMNERSQAMRPKQWACMRLYLLQLVQNMI